MAKSGRPRRFLPADPRVEEPYRLTPQLALRVAVLGFVALGVFAVLLLRLWALQVLSGTKYRVEASANRVRPIQIQAPRGAIVDTSGHVIVSNTLGWGLELWPDNLPRSAAARASELRTLAYVAGGSVAEIQAAIRRSAYDPAIPVVVARTLPTAQVDFVREHEFELPGVQLQETYERSYPYGGLLAQVLGYVGAITPSELTGATAEGYQPQDVIGQAGVESAYDRYLRGTDGSAEVTVDALGQPTGPPQTAVLPEPGNTLRLTIDVGLQRAAEDALRYGIAIAHTSQYGTYADGGAIVALDPRTGAVLAMASNPTYKPSVYIAPTAAKLAPLLDPKVASRLNFPGFNRAIAVGYPPGSIFKPVTALAAMEENILSPDELIPCTPSYSFYGETFNNWDPNTDQAMNLEQAITQSCDTYFYRVGARFYAMPADLGPTLQNWAARFGIGSATGIDLAGESPGLLPTPAWRCKAYGGPPCTGIDQIWKPGYEVQLAIGQGDLLVTPLQMARLYAMIANGGLLVTPHIAEDVETPSSDGAAPQILRDLATQQPVAAGVNPAALAVVQQGLYDGTHSPLGTSYGVFGQFPIPIAGKTGTAQKLIDIPGYQAPLELNQSWWCGYGPVGKPTLVVCALIENGGYGGSAAAPAALRLFEQFFHAQGTVTSHISD